MIDIPFDIPSFSYEKHQSAFCWPVIYSKYDFLSHGFVDGAIKILESQKGDVQIALTCKLSDIIVDISNVVQQSITLQGGEKLDHKIIYSKEYSPTCDWLLNSPNPNDKRIITRLKSDLRKKSFKSLLLLQARKFKRFALMNVNNSYYNAINYNLLMKEWICSEEAKTFNLLTEMYICGKPCSDKKQSQEIAEAFQGLVFNNYDFKSTLKDSISLAINMIVEHHLCQALGDLARLKKSNLHKYLRKGLISGTPKYEGRMLSWYFREHDKDVVRFAHGGERVFYEDYAWPIAELPYCTHYYAHSQREADNMQRRIQNRTYANMKGLENIKFLSKGSAKHQKLYQPLVNFVKNKTLVYVTSAYGHDKAPGLSSFKTPDVLYFEFQIRLLNFLKEQGWYIILKHHPKGLYQDKAYLAPYVDEIVKTPFDANSFEAELFLFDFAGTAFFDTLATRQRALLLNLARRPIDLNDRNSLQRRCAVIDLDFDDRGRIELDESAILTAIRNVPQDIDKRFINSYAY